MIESDDGEAADLGLGNFHMLRTIAAASPHSRMRSGIIPLFPNKVVTSIFLSGAD